MNHPNPQRVVKLFPALLGATFLAAIYFLAISWNLPQVLALRPNGDWLYVFADGDCNSRMERAGIVFNHPGSIIQFHDFENFPTGVIPHTTAPMDHLIAALALFMPSLEMAGLWISPLLGLITVVFLRSWARRINLHPRWPTLILFCFSPALTHAFSLGRPDHQSLLVMLTTAAIAANIAYLRTKTERWIWASGVCWGLALWVSWFEPLILLLSQEILCGIILRRQAWLPARRYALLLTACLGFFFWALEGFRNPWPNAEIQELFPRWATLIGELQPSSPQTLLAWAGLLLIPAPIMLLWNYARYRDPIALLCLGLLVIMTALTGWQARWSPWLVVILCLSLPWIFAPIQKTWIIWTAFFISLWPVAREWETRLMPSDAERMRRAELVVESLMLNDAGDFLRSQPHGGVLAPWWSSPELARVSHQPMVAGSSHQSLPGIADTARFFLATNWEAAANILKKRNVRYVVSDAPERIVPTSTTLLAAQYLPDNVAELLARGKDIPDFLEPVFANSFFRIYKVKE